MTVGSFPLDDALLLSFQEIGRDMFLTGLVSSHTGTMSVRSDRSAAISRGGAMLGHLTESDLIPFAVADEVPDAAGDDRLVHQATYQVTDAKALIYARPPWTMALSLVEDRLRPAGGDGDLGSVPVLISNRPLSSPDVAHLISRTLRESRIVALRGHGVFARGETLADALHMVSLLEEMCKIVQIYRTLSNEEQQPIPRDRHERPPTQNGPFRPRNDQGRRPPPRPMQPRGPVGPGGPGGPPRRGPDGPPFRPPNDPRNQGGPPGGGAP
ncbi:MAG: class aldolase/adducin family protein, partial [Chloroflexi bacterium]|nr:class aldolase/adducin family protein [Chloroflexota bacterium]